MENFLTFILYILQAIVLAKLFKYKGNLKGKGEKSFIFFLALLLPSLMAAFRGATGTDSIMYRTVYEFGEESVLRWQEFESGFMLLISILRKLHLPYQALFFTMSFLTTLFVYLWIDKEKEHINIELSVFTYFMTMYLYSYNALRQALAVAICLYAVSLFIRKRKIIGVILIFIATFFHASALIVLVVVFAKFIFENRYKRIFLMSVVVVALYLVANRDLLGNIVRVVTGSNYYASYITRDAYTDGSMIGYYIKISPIILISAFNFKNYKKYSNMYTYFGLLIGGYILGSLGSVTGTQVGRVGDYFQYLNIVVLGFCATQSMPLPKMGGKRSVKIGKNTVTGIIYSYVLIHEIYSVLIRNFGEYLPYQGLFKL